MDEVEINGQRLKVTMTLCDNRNASARLKDGRIVLSIPSRWPVHIRDRIGKNLLKRAMKSIESGKWDPEHGKDIRFSDGQTISVMGKPYKIRLSFALRSRVRLKDNELQIAVPEGPQRDARIAAIVRREMAKVMGQDLERRVLDFNQKHFRGKVSRIVLKDTKTRWGSCSPDGSICLNFRLLFMPGEILDYVIVHELAHTRYRGHGPKFWELVGKVVPDHKEKRRWLRENGWRYPKFEKSDDEPSQTMLIDSIHEPDETY